MNMTKAFFSTKKVLVGQKVLLRGKLLFVEFSDRVIVYALDRTQLLTFMIVYH